MTLQKITIDNSVKYIHSANSPSNEKSKNYKPKTASIPRKKTENFHKRIENSLKTLQEEDLKYLKDK